MKPVRSMPISGNDATVVVPSTQSTARNPVVPALIAALAVLAGAMAFVFWPRPPPEPVVVVPPPVEEVVVVKPPPEPVAVEVDAGVAEVVEVDAGVAMKSVAAVPKKDLLPARLAKLKTQLDERDRRTGEKDRILHRLLDAAEKDLQVAKTNEQRKAVSAQFDDLQSQLRQ